MRGRPIQIVLAKENHRFELNERALKEVLLQDRVKDKKVVVVSVAGACRKGKSFLMNFFLRYLRSEGRPDWIGSDDTPLEGFSWRGGLKPDTTGILLWSEIFISKLPNGEEVAVLLMDTQGAFDNKSTVRDCATVFALSTLLSSVQIYNLMQNIQADDLQHLQLFTEYGRLAMKDCGIKPFQKLQFLVRDWHYTIDADYGEAGGKLILDELLKISQEQPPELQSLRQHIISCFSERSCFLMPSPGDKVAANAEFNGKLSDIKSDFKTYLQAFVPMILAPKNLIVKEIAGQKVKAKDLFQFFKSYIDIYKGDELPKPKSIFDATAEVNNLVAVAMAKDTYKQKMEKVCGATRPYLNTARLESEHKKYKEEALLQFTKKSKMGGEEFCKKYREALDKALEDMFIESKLHNESKNIFKAIFSRTLVFFVLLVVIFGIASAVFGLFGIDFLVDLCNWAMLLAILTLGTWAYLRYISDNGQMAEKIDDMVSFLWETLMKPVYQYLLQHAVLKATGTPMPEVNG